jgi:hypothetical protein
MADMTALALVDGYPYLFTSRSLQVLRPGWPFEQRTAQGRVDMSGVARASPGSFSRAGPYAVVALEEQQGLVLLDVSNPAAPRQLDHLQEAYAFHGVLLDRPDRIFASVKDAHGSTALAVLRIVTRGGTPRLKLVHFEPIPRLLGARLELYRAAPGVKHGFLLAGTEYLFVAGLRGVRVFNPATLEEHTDVAWTLPDAQDTVMDLALAGLRGTDFLAPFLVYVGTGHQGLYGLDYTSRTTPPRVELRYARQGPGRYPRVLYREGRLHALQAASPASVVRFEHPSGVFLDEDAEPPGLQRLGARALESGEAHALELGARGEVLVASEAGLLAAKGFTASQELTPRRLHPNAA